MKIETLIERTKGELEALNNAITNNNLVGYKIHEVVFRKNRYFLTDDKGNSITGYWDYTRLNHFILGYTKAMKKFNNYDSLLEIGRGWQHTAEKLKATNDSLLNALKEITDMAEKWSIKGLTPTIFKAQEAIKAAEQ